MTYTIDLCVDLVKVGEAPAATFDGVIRNLAVGEWLLEAPYEGLDIASADVPSVDSVRIVNDETGATDYGGLVLAVGGVNGSSSTRVDADGQWLRLAGVDLFGLLATRQAWPTPDTEPPWADAYDSYTGVASTVAANFINYNIGPNALAARQVASVSVIDPAVGQSSRWSARLVGLDQLVGRICSESGISCRPQIDVDGSISFVFGSPGDKSESIVLSDQGELTVIELERSPTTSNAVVGAGQGEGASRAFRLRESSPTPTGINRIETVYEDTSAETQSQLNRSTAGQLALSASEVSVSADIAEGAAQRVRYRKEYDVGDWLGVEIDSVRYRAQVDAVSFSLTPTRQLVRPVLGSSTSNAALQLIRDVNDLADRFDRNIA